MVPALPVAALADGEMAPCRLEGIDVLICRVDGRYFAVAGRCPHAGQALATGRLKGFRIRCPLHGASFDVRDGRCLQGPAECGLVSYPVVIESGKVHVSLITPRRPPG